jgi:hypothetical protein
VISHSLDSQYVPPMSSNAQNILTVLAGAITTGVVGNYLVQRWQRRSWFEQQRQLVHQQELDELKKLYNDITEKAEARLHAMRRVLSTMGDDEEQLRKALEEYRRQLAIWNSSLRSFFPPVTQHYGWHTTLELENEVHGRFVSIGRSLEQAVRLALNGKAPPTRVTGTLQTLLNSQAGLLSTFYQKLARGLESRRDEVLNGKRHTYRSGAFYHFTTSDLIKALFTAHVDSFDVVRPA